MERSKRILIPTDFSVMSLNLVREAVENSPEEKLDVILVYAMHPPDSVTELLFTSKTKLLSDLQSEEFTEGCRMIRSRYQSKIQHFFIDISTGNNRAYMKHYLEGSRVDEVFIPVNHAFNFKGKNSFDPIPLLRRSSVKVTEINLHADVKNGVAVANQLSDLFLPKIDPSNLHRV